jgi:8-oxo-dGTP diphosphatase
MKKLTVGEKFDCKFDFRETCFGIVAKGRELLLVKKNNQYSLIGGGIENGESFEECLRREFLEESGYAINHIEELVCIDCFWLAANKYPMESRANIFIVDICANGKIIPSEEGCSVEWVNIENVLNCLPLPYHKKAIEYFKESEWSKL